MQGFQGLKAVGQWFSASRANGDAAKALEQIRNDIGPSLSLDQLIDTDKPKGSSSKSVESSGAVSTDVVYGQEQLPVLNAEYARIAGDLLTILRDNRGLSLHASAGFVATYLKLARQNMRKGVANYSAVARYLNLADQTNVQLYMENQLRARGHSVVFKLQLASTPTATTAADRLLEALAVFTVGTGHQQAAQVTQTVQLEMAAKNASETEARQALVDALELLFQLQYGLHIRDNLLLPGLRMIRRFILLALAGLVVVSPVLLRFVPKIGWPVLLLSQLPGLAQPYLTVLAIAVLGAVGGTMSGLLSARRGPGVLATLRGDLTKLSMKPLISALVAVTVYLLLSWNSLTGITVTNGGTYLYIAVFAGFSERFFLRLLSADREHEQRESPGQKANGMRDMASP